MKFCATCLRIIDCWACFKSTPVPFTCFIKSSQEFPPKTNLSLNGTRKNYFTLGSLCIDMESINAPKLSVLAVFTGTDCGPPSEHAFTECATDAIYPPPTGTQCGGLLISSLWLSGRSSIYGGRVCGHAKGTCVFERLWACRAAGDFTLVHRCCTLLCLTLSFVEVTQECCFCAEEPERRIQG